MAIDFVTADNAPTPRVEVYDTDTYEVLAVIYVGKDVPIARAEALADLIIVSLRALITPEGNDGPHLQRAASAHCRS